MRQNLEHIGFIESIRAIAAFGVLFFHFLSYNNGTDFLIGNEQVRNWSEFGAQGVEMFYIVSGFVMMYSLSRKNYKILHYGRYLIKRFLRILPLYWSVIAMIYASMYYNWGIKPDLGIAVSNAFFTVDLFEGCTWLNGVFETLGVEMQFYLILGLLFPLLRSGKALRYAVFAVWLGLGYYTRDDYTVLLNAPFFIIGITLHELYYKRDSYSDWAVIALILMAEIYLHMYEDVAIVLITVALFTFRIPNWKVTNALGKISYSVYLTHGLFGGTFLYFMTSPNERGISTPWMLVPAILLCIVGAWITYLLIEKWSTRMSKQVPLYKKKEATPQPD